MHMNRKHGGFLCYGICTQFRSIQSHPPCFPVHMPGRVQDGEAADRKGIRYLRRLNKGYQNIRILGDISHQNNVIKSV